MIGAEKSLSVVGSSAWRSTAVSAGATDDSGAPPKLGSTRAPPWSSTRRFVQHGLAPDRPRRLDKRMLLLSLMARERFRRFVGHGPRHFPAHLGALPRVVDDHAAHHHSSRSDQPECQLVHACSIVQFCLWVRLAAAARSVKCLTPRLAGHSPVFQIGFNLFQAFWRNRPQIPYRLPRSAIPLAPAWSRQSIVAPFPSRSCCAR